MSCGSYVVKMEERKTRWHLFAIPIFITVLAVGMAVYMKVRDEDVKAAHQKSMAEADRTLDPARQRQLQEDDAERQRLVKRRQKIEAERRKRFEERRAMEKWRELPTAKKTSYLNGLLAEVKARIAGLRAQAQSEATQDFRAWLNKLDQKVAAVVTFIEADQLDHAKGLLEGIDRELADMVGDEEGGGETGEEAPKAEEASAGGA